MKTQSSERMDRFIGLMREIFELDKSDLDFGIYRIINMRKDEIEKFLSTDLPKKIRETLEPFAADNTSIDTRIREIRKMCEDVGVEISASKFAKEYDDLMKKSAAGTDIAALESEVYTALYSFFSRYYDEGDFISKRRYKEGVYAIPYEGEEVKLYWANHDQYYIKTSENFRDYTFTDNGKKVHFRLVNATAEQDNNKESDVNKRVFMLYTEIDECPNIKTIEEADGDLIIRFVHDIPASKDVKYSEANYVAISEHISKYFPDWNHLLIPLPSSNRKFTVLEKHLTTYVAKNTFDYFIHKDLRGFLTRELDFFIKSEIIYIDDIDADDEKRADGYFATVRAVKRVGNIIIDFLAQIENFQKKLWLKKKFVVETNWCITLDCIDDSFYPEIASNARQIAEWRELYAIDEVKNNLVSMGYSEPLTVDFLRHNNNLLVDTRHFTTEFKHRLVESIDGLDEKLCGLLVHSENFQALRLLHETYCGKVDNIHIDPPYNTDTNPFLYKNSYRHSSWASMMFDRINQANMLLEENGDFITHIDENEYELLANIFDIFPLSNRGTIIWNKLNPMLGGKGIAIQHEYVLFRSYSDGSIMATSEAKEKLQKYAKKAISENGGINDLSRAAYAKLVSRETSFTGGDKAYKLLDHDGKIYRLVAMGAPEKRTNEKFFIPLIHPVSGKPCPVPENGWSRTPETLKELISQGMVVFGKDETTLPQKIVYLNESSRKQLSSVINDGTSGKATLDKLGISFPYAHPISLYELLLSANDPQMVVDCFAGSGTTGHAVINLNRADRGNRKYVLIEMGDYFDKVTLPRIKKVVYTSDWKGGKPQSRNTGISQIVKYITLESYEDALQNIRFSEKQKTLLESIGQEYLVRYSFDSKNYGSSGILDNPFGAKLIVTENNETKEKNIDVPETFNYLIGFSVENIKYEFNDGLVLFASYRGTLPDGRKALVIWRNVTGDKIDDDKKIREYFIKQDRIEIEVVFVNGDCSLHSIRDRDETWEVFDSSVEFWKRMFEDTDRWQ